MFFSFIQPILCNVLYKWIGIHDKCTAKYFEYFDNTVISINAYSGERSVRLYHILWSIVYPIRYFKCSDIIYEDSVMLEVVHNSNKSVLTTVIPSKDVIGTSTESLVRELNGLSATKASIVSFSLNDLSFIRVFNEICHSFIHRPICTKDFAVYVNSKFSMDIKPPYSIEIIDNDFAEQTFKEDETIKINKSHEH